MSSFKDQIQSDNEHVFLNCDEFSDMHNVNGKNMPAQVDDDEATEKAVNYIGYGDGVFKRRRILFVSEKDFGALPVIDSTLSLDNKKYVVKDTSTAMGIHSITLEAITSGNHKGR